MSPTPSDKRSYLDLVRHYEDCLKEFGPTHRGVDWPDEADLAVRFDVMLELMRADHADAPSLLDLGCGPGLLLNHINRRLSTSSRTAISYQGIDLSQPMIDAARTRHPSAAFSVRDILVDPLSAQSVDYVVMNGVLTEKRELTFEAMEDFAFNIITAAFQSARIGIAFNVMSTIVDWQRDDLFHWPFERMIACVSQLTPHFVIRADYGLREYTTYLFREANKND